MNRLISSWQNRISLYLIHAVRQDCPLWCLKNISKPQVCVWFLKPYNTKSHILLKSITVFLSIVRSWNYLHIYPRDSHAWQRYVQWKFFPCPLCCHPYNLGSNTGLCSHSEVVLILSEISVEIARVDSLCVHNLRLVYMELRSYTVYVPTTSMQLILGLKIIT